MSERNYNGNDLDVGGCLRRLAGMIIGGILMAVVISMVVTAIETRDGYIRDPQRRVGQLEQER